MTDGLDEGQNGTEAEPQRSSSSEERPKSQKHANGREFRQSHTHDSVLIHAISPNNLKFPYEIVEEEKSGIKSCSVHESSSSMSAPASVSTLS